MVGCSIYQSYFRHRVQEVDKLEKIMAED